MRRGAAGDRMSKCSMELLVEEQHDSLRNQSVKMCYCFYSPQALKRHRDIEGGRGKERERERDETDMEGPSESMSMCTCTFSPN